MNPEDAGGVEVCPWHRGVLDWARLSLARPGPRVGDGALARLCGPHQEGSSSIHPLAQETGYNRGNSATLRARPCSDRGTNCVGNYSRPRRCLVSTAGRDWGRFWSTAGGSRGPSTRAIEGATLEVGPRRLQVADTQLGSGPRLSRHRRLRGYRGTSRMRLAAAITMWWGPVWSRLAVCPSTCLAR